MYSSVLLCCIVLLCCVGVYIVTFALLLCLFVVDVACLCVEVCLMMMLLL